MTLIWVGVVIGVVGVFLSLKLFDMWANVMNLEKEEED
jgi:hypothetical protein